MSRAAVVDWLAASKVGQAWISWRVGRQAGRGEFDDPITQRRRAARAARFEEVDPEP